MAENNKETLPQTPIFRLDFYGNHGFVWINGQFIDLCKGVNVNYQVGAGGTQSMEVDLKLELGGKPRDHDCRLDLIGNFSPMNRTDLDNGYRPLKMEGLYVE